MNQHQRITPTGLVGMIHLEALPGTPGHTYSPDQIIDRAVRDAKTLAECGFDSILIENMHDTPYLLREVGSEIIAMMTSAISAVRQAVDIPLGLQILAGANQAAMSVAHATGCSFIRAEGFAYAAVADEGMFATADAGPLLRHRKAIGAENVAIWSDVKKKHSAHAITGDLDLEEMIRGHVFCGTDAVIITGTATGSPVDSMDLQSATSLQVCPVIVGSGATPESISHLLGSADAVIIGSAIKTAGNWRNPVDPERAARAVHARDTSK